VPIRHLVDATELVEGWSALLEIEADIAATAIRDAVRTAPPLRIDASGVVMDPARLVHRCGLTGKSSRRHGLDGRVDSWYHRLADGRVGSPWSTVPRAAYAEKRVALNFFSSLCYARLVSDDPLSQHLLTQTFWSALESRLARRFWGLPDGPTMSRLLAGYPAPNIDDLEKTIGLAGIAFTCALVAGQTELGEASDRMLVSALVIGDITDDICGLLSGFGRVGSRLCRE
jgi:hypothetical protein